MYQYPKSIQTSSQLLQKLKDAGMQIDIPDYDAIEVLETLGYYRLKGYFFHYYDRLKGQFLSGTTFSDAEALYEFDSVLSNLLMKYLSKIEISLRARLVTGLLQLNDALILNDPSMFRDKELFWKNQGVIASEISRSNDVFIQHNFDKYEGSIPLWAAVEVMSFGTLTKVLKNMKPGTAAYPVLIGYYRFRSTSGNLVPPSQKMFNSWIQAAAVMRNICAHHSRIYNRTICVFPELTNADSTGPKKRYTGLYPILLAMKYLRPNDSSWRYFAAELQSLLSQFGSVVDLKRLDFPADWVNHLQV